MYEVIIIGAGPAGLSAALWADELGLRALLLERQAEIGGQLSWVYNPIANHLGVERADDGGKMRELFAAQIARRKFELRLNTIVARVDANAKRVVLQSGEELAATNLILATGLRRRRLNAPGEMEFAGRGVVHSATRDRHLLARRDVCVVGGGDAAVENALLIAEVCPRVWLIHRGKALRARNEFTERLTANKRITTLLETTVERITGGEVVEAVELKIGDGEESKRQHLRVGGVVIRIGYAPNTELIRDQVDVDANNYVRTTSEGETNIENVFAVGDINNPRAPTVSGAIGAGATAAKVIAARLGRSAAPDVAPV